MSNSPLEPSQRIAARVLGFSYLFAMAAGLFSEVYVRGSLLTGDAFQSAQNIIAHKELFRLGIIVEIVTFVTDATVVTASYVILASVQRQIALYAAILRVIAVAVSVMMAASSFDVLRILSGRGYLDAFEADQLAALAQLSLGAHGATYLVLFVFLGLSSALFASLWIRSGYVPRPLGWIGVIGGTGLVAGSLLVLIVPTLSMIDPWYGVPQFLFEVGLGLLLLVRGLGRPPARSA